MNAKQTRIAIADDHFFIRDYIRGMIERIPGYSVQLEAQGAAVLLEQLEAAEMLPHILLLDISLPEVNGFELMEILKRRYPAIRVLVVSVYREEFAVTQMLRLGARGFLEKERLNELPEALRLLRRGRPYFSRGVPSAWVEAARRRRRPVFFTNREKQTLLLCASGYQFKQIADVMAISEKTAHEYKSRLFRKLEVHSRSALVRKAMGSGLLRIGEPIPRWEDELAKRHRHNARGTAGGEGRKAGK